MVLALALAQVAASTAAGLSLTIASVAAYELSGLDQIAGLAQTSIVAGASLLTIPLARISATHGRRIGLVLGYSVAACGALVAYIAVTLMSWPLLLAGLVLVGGGTVASLAARFAAADAARVPSDIAVTIGFVLWAATVGSIAGPHLVGLFGEVGEAGAFLALALLYVTATAIVAIWVPSTLGSPSARNANRLPRSLVVHQLRTHPLAMRGLVISTLVHMSMIAQMAMAPVHLHHASAPASFVGAVMSSHLASMYILSPVFGILVTRFGADHLGAVGLGTSLVSSLLLAYGAAEHDVVFVIGLVLLGFSWSLGMISGSTLVSQGLDSAARSASQSSTDLAINVGGGIASLLAGIVVAALGYATLALSVGVVLVMALLLMWLRPRQDRL